MYRMHNKKIFKYSELSSDRKFAVWALGLTYPILIIGSIISAAHNDSKNNIGQESVTPTIIPADTMYVTRAQFHDDEPIKIIEMVNKSGEPQTSVADVHDIGYWANEKDTVLVRDNDIVAITWHERMRAKNR